MSSAMEAMRLGGFMMWATLALGAGLLAVAVQYARRPETRLLPVLASLALVTLFSGGFGFATALITVAEYLARERPADTFTIAVTGLGESLYNVALASLLVLAASLTATVGVVRRSLRTA